MAASRVVVLTIDKTGTLVPPDPGRAEPGQPVAFVMMNDHASHDFRVEINFDNVTTKQDKTTKRNPFTKSGSRFHKLNPGEIDFIDQQVRPKTDFGTATLPFTTYKYTVQVTDVTANTPTVDYDPDWDVPPP